MLQSAQAGERGVERFLVGGVVREELLYEGIVGAFAGGDGFKAFVERGMAAIDSQFAATFLKGGEERGLECLGGRGTLEILCPERH